MAAALRRRHLRPQPETPHATPARSSRTTAQETRQKRWFCATWPQRIRYGHRRIVGRASLRIRNGSAAIIEEIRQSWPNNESACDPAHNYTSWQTRSFRHVRLTGRRAGRSRGRTSGQGRTAGDATRAVQGGAVDERGSSVRRLRAGRHVGTLRAAAPQKRSVAGRRPDSAGGYPGLAVAARFGRGHVPWVIPVSC